MLFLIGSNLGEFLPHSNHTQTYHAVIIKDMGDRNVGAVSEMRVIQLQLITLNLVLTHGPLSIKHGN